MTGEQLPSQRRDRPGFAPDSLSARRFVVRAYHPTMAGSTVGRWLAAMLWAAVIFVLSAQPDLSTGLGTWDLVLRKIAHLAEYAVLGALLLRALNRPPAAFALGVAYAITDEIHQHFVRGRHASPVDVLIDAAGIAVGIAAYSAARRRFRLPGWAQ